MLLTISRQLRESDYDTLVEWGKWWRFPMPPKEFLPDNGTCGLMIESGDLPLAAGFLYLTNSDTVWLEYVISNPKLKDKEDRDAVLTRLVNALLESAKEMGYKWVFTSVKNQHLLKKYTECGFQIGSTGTTEMVAIL